MLLSASLFITATLSAWLLLIVYNYDIQQAPPLLTSSTLTKRTYLHFEPRHHHAVSSGGHVTFKDISSLTTDVQAELAQSRKIRIQRPRSYPAFAEAYSRRLRTRPHRPQEQSFPEDSPESGWWQEDEVPGPDVESRETVLVLAKMTSNAYLQSVNESGWYDLGKNWSIVRFSAQAVYCVLTTTLMPSRIQSGGSPMATAFVVMYLRHLTTPLLFSQSRVRNTHVICGLFLCESLRYLRLVVRSRAYYYQRQI
jgi:hypothetical protein